MGSGYLTLDGEEAAFARGGNRLCFIHPEDSSKCIKVLRPDRSPEIKRDEKGFPKSLRPLSSFDDNLEEARVFLQIENTVGEPAFTLIPRYYGMRKTNYGDGLVTDLIRDEDGKISISLKQYLWTYGLDEVISDILDKFKLEWSRLGIPSRDLLLHNIVVRYANNRPERLYVIDGLGWSTLFPLANYFSYLAKRKTERKIHNFELAIKRLLDRKADNKDFGIHGWMETDQRSQ